MKLLVRRLRLEWHLLQALLVAWLTATGVLAKFTWFTTTDPVSTNGDPVEHDSAITTNGGPVSENSDDTTLSFDAIIGRLLGSSGPSTTTAPLGTNVQTTDPLTTNGGPVSENSDDTTLSFDAIIGRLLGSSGPSTTTAPIATNVQTTDPLTTNGGPASENSDVTTRGNLDVADDSVTQSGHPCLRTCVVGAPPKECFYQFEVEDYFAMSKACYNCPSNSTDCSRPDCVPADGAKRSLMVVNRQLPGPAINVCHGDRIIVEVTNHLMEQSVTIHWHGIHQVGTPYMDGVPFVTQCPLLPQARFVYQFKADPPGTHFWHSHLGVQRADGIFGALIVRMPAAQDPNTLLFDEDLPSHTIQILDWDHISSIDKFLQHYHAGGDNKPPTLLVNGRGMNYELPSTSQHVPLARFDVKQGVRYRFRLINAGFLNCPIQLSVDNHNLTIIGSDSSLLQPVEVESLVSYAGERFDFVLSASQPVDNYWLRLRGLMDCSSQFKSAHQVAVLHYDGAPDEDPRGDVMYEAANRPGLQLNAVNAGLNDEGNLVIPEINSAMDDDVRLKPEADVTFYVSYDFYKLDNPLFHKHSLYGYDEVVRDNERSPTPQLNHISMKMPPAPPLSQLADLDPNMFCNGSSVGQYCESQYCECTHLLRVPLGAVVELVIIDEYVSPVGNHPFHLHGTDFRVIAMDRVGFNTTVGTIQALDQSGRITRKLKKAPIKDTVTIPHGGYTIVRFRATNPGIWMFHCHLDFHSEIGMALVFQFGNPEDFPPVPKHFPRCGNGNHGFNKGLFRI